MSKYANKIKEQIMKNFEERARAYEITKDERDQLFDDLLKPRKPLIDSHVLKIEDKNKT